jgi:mRNA interferase MazF
MMKKIIAIYKQFDIVTVPFPFTDSSATKRRPAIVLSSHKNFNNETGHSVMAMITSARNKSWPCDISIADLVSSGLPKPSVIRMKFFTLDHKLIIDTIGVLSAKDKAALKKMMKSVFDKLL